MPDTIDKCKDCFWLDVSLKNWQTFECKAGIDKEQRIQEIKSKKCKECKEGKDNYSKKWVCRKCGASIDGHNAIGHDSMCDSCWTEEVDNQ